jgi:hypothetical protein
VEGLEAARARRWWRTGRRVGSLARAAAFVDDVGFALLFPKPGVELPSLWDAASDRPIRSLGEEWGPDAERVWGWKDELPRRGLAWYGRFLRGRPSFLAPDLLADLYPRSGRPEDFEEDPLSPQAHRIARILLRSGPQPTSALREALDVEGRRGGERFSAALTELGRRLVVTHHGVEDEGAGWPSAVLELTARAFPIPRRRDRERAVLRAADRFLDTMLLARPADLGRAFGWSAREARGALEALARAGRAEVSGGGYRPATARRGRGRGSASPPRGAARGQTSRRSLAQRESS